MTNQAQRPFDRPAGGEPARIASQNAIRRAGRTRAWTIAAATITAAGIILLALLAFFTMRSRQPEPDAFAWHARALWAMGGLAIVAALGAPFLWTRKSRPKYKRIGDAAVAAILAVLLAYTSCKGIGDWNADNASGPVRATATVVDVWEEQDDNDWRLSVRMPDGGTVDWPLDDEPHVSEGDEVDVTYYPRTNTLVSLGPSR